MQGSSSIFKMANEEEGQRLRESAKHVNNNRNRDNIRSKNGNVNKNC